MLLRPDCLPWQAYLPSALPDIQVLPLLRPYRMPLLPHHPLCGLLSHTHHNPLLLRDAYVLLIQQVLQMAASAQDVLYNWQMPFYMMHSYQRFVLCKCYCLSLSNPHKECSDQSRAIRHAYRRYVIQCYICLL